MMKTGRAEHESERVVQRRRLAGGVERERRCGGNATRERQWRHTRVQVHDCPNRPAFVGLYGPKPKICIWTNGATTACGHLNFPSYLPLLVPCHSSPLSSYRSTCAYAPSHRIEACTCVCLSTPHTIMNPIELHPPFIHANHTRHSTQIGSMCHSYIIMIYSY